MALSVGRNPLGVCLCPSVALPGGHSPFKVLPPVALSIATDSLGYTCTHRDLPTVTLTQVHAGFPAWPGQQQCPGQLSAQVPGHRCYQTVPSTAGKDDKDYSKSKKQLLTSAGLLYTVRKQALRQAQEPAN